MSVRFDFLLAVRLWATRMQMRKYAVRQWWLR